MGRKKPLLGCRKCGLDLQRPSRTLARPKDFPQGAVPFPLEFFDEKEKEISGLQGILQRVVGDKGRQPVLAAEFAEIV